MTREKEKLKRLIREKTSGVDGNELLDIYEDILETIRTRILPTIGRPATAAVVERALALAAEAHPLLSDVKMNEEGLSLEALREQAARGDKAEDIQAGLEQLLTDLVDAIATLTGDVLIRELAKEIEKSETGK